MEPKVDLLMDRHSSAFLLTSTGSIVGSLSTTNAHETVKKCAPPLLNLIILLGVSSGMSQSSVVTLSTTGRTLRRTEETGFEERPTFS